MFRPSTRSTASTISRHQQPASLARRLLFPHLPPGADLPPLFLSQACPRELHDEVYDFIALALRAFVNTWWTKLTRYDKEFLPQITNIVIHVVRCLEQRLLDADLSLLVLGDIPALITQHYRDYRQAVSKASTSYAIGGALSIPQLFHQLQPHMAVSPDGSLDEEYFRQAVDHILRECLPTEDYAPEAERFIAREIILKVVVKDVIPRITQPWFLQKMVLDMLGPSSDASPEQVCHSISFPTLRPNFVLAICLVWVCTRAVSLFEIQHHRAPAFNHPEIIWRMHHVYPRVQASHLYHPHCQPNRLSPNSRVNSNDECR